MIYKKNQEKMIHNVKWMKNVTKNVNVIKNVIKNYNEILP